MRSRLTTDQNRTAAVLGAAMAWMAFGASAQPATPSYILDDVPAAPLVSPPGGFGSGAENPWSLPVAGPPIIGPSPTLGLVGGLLFGDGDIFTRSFGAVPALMSLAPGAPYLSALSLNTVDPGQPMYLVFSVDRRSQGVAGIGALRQQALLNQAPADIYKSASLFRPPSRYVGGLGPGPYSGDLGARWSGRRSNTLLLDDSQLSLRAGAPVTGPGVTMPPIGAGTHDNVDAFDVLPTSPLPIPLAGWTRSGYVALYPDLPTAFGLPASSIFDVAAGTTSACGLFASGAQLGLGFGDVIDSLIVYDNGPQGSLGCGGPGAQPGVDFVLFSLAPESPSLLALGLDAGDVFFSDFAGAFARYARASELAVGGGGALPGTGDNVDALDLMCIADIDQNGIVEVVDVSLYVACFGTPCADLDLDGTPSTQRDTNLLMMNFGCTS